MDLTYPIGANPVMYTDPEGLLAGVPIGYVIWGGVAISVTECMAIEPCRKAFQNAGKALDNIISACFPPTNANNIFLNN